MLSTVAGAIAAAALALTPVALSIQDDKQPPSIVQLCAATNIQEVDALLDGVADTALVGSLEPLVTLTVPKDADTVTLRGDATLAEVRGKLDCAPTEDEQKTTAPEPTVEAPAAEPETPDTAGSGDDGFSQLDTVPSLPAQTGGGPAE